MHGQHKKWAREPKDSVGPVRRRNVDAKIVEGRQKTEIGKARYASISTASGSETYGSSNQKRVPRPFVLST